MTSPVPVFTESHAALLHDFLSSPQRPEGTMPYPQLTGFLFSLANSPEMILPSEWMPMVFKDQEAGYETKEEAEGVLQAMMALYNECGRKRSEGSFSLPPGCEMRHPPLENLNSDAPLSQWARGFMVGHNYLQDIWDECVPETLDEEFGAMLMVLSFFATRNLADTYYKEAKGGESLEDFAQTVVRVFPDAMKEYAILGRSIFQVLREEQEGSPQPLGRQKIGRNEPCPCGSGKKFKKCCWI